MVGGSLNRDQIENLGADFLWCVGFKFNMQYYLLCFLNYYKGIVMLKASRCLVVGWLVVLSLVLSGCADWHTPSPPPSDTATGIAFGTVGGAVVGTAASGGNLVGGAVGAAVGGIAGGFIGSYLDSHKTLVQKLQSNHVQVIQIGDQVKLVLPSDLFFLQQTPVLNTKYYPVLDQIVTFLQGLNKINVKIAGYTDNTQCTLRNMALSRQQAQAIADYLWNHGIDTRVLYAVGYGEQQSIASNLTREGRQMNRRIEISLQEITDYYDH